MIRNPLEIYNYAGDEDNFPNQMAFFGVNSNKKVELRLFTEHGAAPPFILDYTEAACLRNWLEDYLSDITAKI